MPTRYSSVIDTQVFENEGFIYDFFSTDICFSDKSAETLISYNSET